MKTKTIGKAAKKSSAPTGSATTTLAESGLSSPDRKKVKRLQALIYGPPKIGKSIMAHALPNTRTLDFDDGMQSIEWAIKAGMLDRRLEDIVYRTILPPEDPKAMGSVLDIATDTVDEWLADEDIPPEEWNKPYPQFWDTIIIDSASPVTKSAIIKGLKENARLGISKSWGQYTGEVVPMRKQDWGSAASLFEMFVQQCRQIGKNVVVICHEYYNTTEEGTLVAIQPLVIGQLRQTLPGSFDEVWYASVKGTRKDPKYVFQTTPDSLRHCGSRLGCLAPEEPADFYAIRDKVAKFYGVDPELLWTATHGSAERESELAEELSDVSNAI